MTPQKQIAPGLKANINLIPGDILGEDLPAYYHDGIYTTRWKLTLKERIQVFLFGNIWLNLMSSTHPPVRLDVEAPFEVVKVNYPGWSMSWEKEQQNPDDISDDKPEFEDEEEKKRKEFFDRGFFS